MGETATTYPPYEAIRRARLDARRRRAVRALRDADRLAGAAGGRLLVFGSLVEGDFQEGSDLDVALFGLSGAADLETAATIETALRRAGFAADVIAERFLSPSFRERIARVGAAPGALG